MCLPNRDGASCVQGSDIIFTIPTVIIMHEQVSVQCSEIIFTVPTATRSVQSSQIIFKILSVIIMYEQRISKVLTLFL